jgi:ABC-type multidrug transport system fused ATPase/permease subunit
MEEGKLGKPYDLKLMARLGGFLRPYWSLMGLSLLFVLIMAGLDLLIPYLTKEAIDRYIVVGAKEVVLRGDGSPEDRRFWNQYGQKFIPKKEPGRFLLPPDVLQSMDRKEIARFQKVGFLTENRYYLFVPEKPEEEGLLKKYPSSFERSGSYWFISFDRMKELKREDLLLLRKRDVEGVFHIALFVILILAVNFGLNFSGLCHGVSRSKDDA